MSCKDDILVANEKEAQQSPVRDDILVENEKEP